MSTCTSAQLMHLGLRKKESPRDNSLISEPKSCIVESLMAVSSCSGEVVSLFWEWFLLFFLWTLCGLIACFIVALLLSEVFIDGVLVICAAGLEVFVEGVERCFLH